MSVISPVWLLYWIVIENTLVRITAVLNHPKSHSSCSADLSTPNSPPSISPHSPIALAWLQSPQPLRVNPPSQLPSLSVRTIFVLEQNDLLFSKHLLALMPPPICHMLPFSLALPDKTLSLFIAQLTYYLLQKTSKIFNWKGFLPFLSSHNTAFVSF